MLRLWYQLLSLYCYFCDIDCYFCDIGISCYFCDTKFYFWKTVLYLAKKLYIVPELFFISYYNEWGMRFGNYVDTILYKERLYDNRKDDVVASSWLRSLGTWICIHFRNQWPSHLKLWIWFSTVTRHIFGFTIEQYFHMTDLFLVHDIGLQYTMYVNRNIVKHLINLWIAWRKCEKPGF